MGNSIACTSCCASDDKKAGELTTSGPPVHVESHKAANDEALAAAAAAFQNLATGFEGEQDRGVAAGAEIQAAGDLYCLDNDDGGDPEPGDFDGSWKVTKKDKVLTVLSVIGGTVIWKPGHELYLHFPGGNKVHLKDDKKTMGKGELQANGELHWKDGSIWKREKDQEETAVVKGGLVEQPPQGSQGPQGLPGSFIVILDTAGDATGMLGANAAPAQVKGYTGLLIKAIKAKGLLRQWNDEHPEQQLKEGDCIVEVNGICGTSHELHRAIIQNMDMKIVLTMVVIRDAETKADKTWHADAPTEPVNEQASGSGVDDKATSEPGDTPRPDDLILAKIDLGFKLFDGSIKDISFYKMPLGLDVTRSSPIQVKNVLKGGSGSEKGVLQGWEIVTVNGLDVTGKDVQNIFRMLKTLTRQLPAK